MEEKKADGLNEQASFEGSRWVGVGGQADRGRWRNLMALMVCFCNYNWGINASLSYHDYSRASLFI